MPRDVTELLNLFDLERTGESTFRGPQPRTHLQRLFGGQVLGQTLVAAAGTVDPERPVHSLNAYFLRPGHNDLPLDFEVEVSRDGNTFSNRRVVTRQGDRVIFEMTCSFQRREPGLDHSAAEPLDVQPPDASPSLKEVLERRFGGGIAMLSEWDALDVRLAARPDATASGGSMRAWVRTKERMPENPLASALRRSSITPRTASVGRGSPVPQAWLMMRLRCSCAASSSAMRFSENLPKPVVSP